MAQYSKNDIVTVKIEDIGTEGEGIGKLEGFTLFVKDAVMGKEELCLCQTGKGADIFPAACEAGLSIS